MPEMDHVEVYADEGSVWVRQVHDTGGIDIIRLHPCQVAIVVDWLAQAMAAAQAAQAGGA